MPGKRCGLRSILRKALATSQRDAEREAALLRQRIEAELLGGELACRARGGPTWGDALDAYVADYERRHARLDRELYRLEILRRELGDDTPLAHIDTARVLAWRDRAQTRGLAPASLNHYTAMVTAVVNCAVARGLVDWLTQEQVAALLEVSTAAATEKPAPGHDAVLPLHLLIALH